VSDWFEIETTKYTRFAFKYVDNKIVAGVKYAERGKQFHIEVCVFSTWWLESTNKSKMRKAKRITDVVKKNKLERAITKKKLRNK